MSNLVNYFGRQDQVDKVEVSPILLQKGASKVALYGMGSLRDERLNRMWQGKKVRFLRPDIGDSRHDGSGTGGGDDDDDSNVQSNDDSNWFNIFCLHQNRDLGRGTKNCVHESMIPEWMDLIVWGHEHECLIEPQESVVGTFRITQPGSTVATSLSAGETARKHVGLLDVRGNQFRLTPIPLTQVRAFTIGETSLSGPGSSLDPEDPRIDEKMSRTLEEQVRALLREARRKHKALRSQAAQTGNDPKDLVDNIYQLEKPDSVLVRLKVEHSGFSTLNNQRFGAKFVGEVANPSDILLFHRKRQSNNSGEGSGNKTLQQMDRPVVPDALEEMNVEDLIKEHLEIGEMKLEILSEEKLNAALEQFVDKESRQAITDATADMLSRKQNNLIQGNVRSSARKDDTEDFDDEGSDENECIPASSESSELKRNERNQHDSLEAEGYSDQIDDPSWGTNSSSYKKSRSRNKITGQLGNKTAGRRNGRNDQEFVPDQNVQQKGKDNRMAVDEVHDNEWEAGTASNVGFSSRNTATARTQSRSQSTTTERTRRLQPRRTRAAVSYNEGQDINDDDDDDKEDEYNDNDSREKEGDYHPGAHADEGEDDDEEDSGFEGMVESDGEGPRHSHRKRARATKNDRPTLSAPRVTRTGTNRQTGRRTGTCKTQTKYSYGESFGLDNDWGTADTQTER